jgi:hypothetical protein
VGAIIDFNQCDSNGQCTDWTNPGSRPSLSIMLQEHLGRLGDESDSFSCRRIFSDGYFWLTVDLDENREIDTFHLTYAFGTPKMCCYRWRRDQGLRHYRVDDGGDVPFYNSCPLLLTTEAENGDRIIEMFKEASLEIDLAVGVFILQKLKQGSMSSLTAS